MCTRKDATQNSKEAAQNTIKQSLQDYCQQVNVSKQTHVLISPILPKYPVKLIVAVVFLGNSEQKVLDGCENVGEENQEKTLIG